MNKKDNLIWIDMEMSGLNPDSDVILEIATVITNNNLDIIAKGPQLVIHQPDEILNDMGEWCKVQHEASGLIKEVQESKITIDMAAQQTLDFIQQYCEPEVSPLCGNSVWQDRTFLRVYMPSIVHFLHYKIIDVSSIKEVAQRWYPNNPHAEFEKKEYHRALPDILESIEELKHFRKYFFIK